MDDSPNAARSPADWDSSVDPAVRSTADTLMGLFYQDLKRVAHRERRRVGAGMTMQTTALVHEAYFKIRGRSDWNDDTHFVRAAALAMRHALVSHALERLAAKRGGGATHVPLTEGFELDATDDVSLVALDDALATLSKQSLRLAQVVECRFFAGYDEAETAAALGISERTVRRDWTLARAWLQREMEAG